MSTTTIRPLLLCLLTTCALSWSLNVNKRQASGQWTEQNENCLFNFCNETQDYPAEKLTQIISKNPKFSEWFGRSVVEPLDNIRNRLAVGEENVCKVRTITMFPQKGQNIAKQWRTVVNVGAGIQGVTFETCVESDASCLDEGSLALGYRTFCRQYYVILKLVVMKENDDLMLDKFPVPAGCNCVYTTS